MGAVAVRAAIVKMQLTIAACDELDGSVQCLVGSLQLFLQLSGC